MEMEFPRQLEFFSDSRKLLQINLCILWTKVPQFIREKKHSIPYNRQFTAESMVIFPIDEIKMSINYNIRELIKDLFKKSHDQFIFVIQNEIILWVIGKGEAKIWVFVRKLDYNI